MRNSNVVIDKSYIEKGTSFVNAFENSNVVLKDCGTPIPKEESAAGMVSILNTKLTEEIDRHFLPPWVSYNVRRFDNLEDASSGQEDKVVIGNGLGAHFVQFVGKSVVSHDDTIGVVSGYRGILMDRLDASNDYTALPSFSIQSQILSEGKISTKDVDFTVSRHILSHGHRFGHKGRLAT